MTLNHYHNRYPFDELEIRPGRGTCMNARHFNLFCIAVIVAVGAAAILAVQSVPGGGHVSIALPTEGALFPSLDLALSLVILFDFGLMVAALVWLFGDRPESSE